MAQRIKLNQDFEGYKTGSVITVTNRKLIQMTKDKIKFNARLVAGTGNREYVFEEKTKEDKEKIIVNKKNKK